MSIDPSPNQGGETDPKENPDNTLNLNKKMTKVMKLILKFLFETIIATQNAYGLAAPRVANYKGLRQKMCIL